jgi:hypothetical protein
MSNPVRLIDPNGKEIIAMDENAKRNIRNTLTKAEVKYVKFNKDGTLNKDKLNKSKSMSENMKAIKAEANSEVIYKYAVTEKDHDGQEFYETSEKNFYRGVTEMPGAKNNPSPDKDVWVLTSSVASEKLQVKNTAHEGYAHAYIYEQTRDILKSSHTAESRGSIGWDNELKMNTVVSTKVQTNLPLEQRIKIVENETLKNYEDTH